jgi:hypothetical protein
MKNSLDCLCCRSDFWLRALQQPCNHGSRLAGALRTRQNCLIIGELSLVHAAVLMDKPDTLRLLIEAGAALDEACAMFDEPVSDGTDGNKPNIPQTARMLSVVMTKDLVCMVTLLDTRAVQKSALTTLVCCIWQVLFDNTELNYLAHVLAVCIDVICIPHTHFLQSFCNAAMVCCS